MLCLDITQILRGTDESVKDEPTDVDLTYFREEIFDVN